MKKILTLILCFTLLLTLAACGKKAEETQPAPPPVQTQAPTLPPETQAPTTEPEVLFSYSDLAGYTFHFNSGAGAWSTDLTVDAQGFFTGVYHDTEMGDVGTGYPQGTVYYSEFIGSFGTPVRINDYTYSLPIQSLSYIHPVDTQQIRGQQLYRYTDAAGLAGAAAMLLYLPGAPVAQLPADFCQWAHLSNEPYDFMPFYGLYNEATQQGFYSDRSAFVPAALPAPVEVLPTEPAPTAAPQNTAVLRQSMLNSISLAEQLETQIMGRLDAASLQEDYNAAALERYEVWDTVLNDQWRLLKQALDKDTMDQLTKEQLKWIAEKEAEAADQSFSDQGTPMYTASYYSVAGDMTKERVYYLTTYLQ